MRFEQRRAFAPWSDIPLPIEIGFLRDWLTDPTCLYTAADLARRQRVCPARVLIFEGFVSEALFYRALARHLDVLYLDGWPRLSDRSDLIDAIALGHVKLADGSAVPWLAAPSGATLRRLLKTRALRQSPPDIGLTSPSHFRAILQLRYNSAIAYRARDALPEAAPAFSARRMADWRPRIVSIAVPVAALAGIAFTPRPVTDGFGLLFFASIALRLVVCAEGLDQRQAEPMPLADRDLPNYCVLIPLRHETDVVKDLIAALEDLDYPRAKLDVLILVEPEDHATRDTLAMIALPPWCHILVGPTDDGRLRTKPRALNLGLLFAQGTLVTVYDAEDRPDSDQLRQAAARFADAPDRLGCLQARLAIGNGGSCWLSRLFALEYAALFDLFNIGTSGFCLPLALGGTSNHFRMSALRTVGGWDAWNVTEDADLGLRLARFGYRIETIASTTMEDAPERIGAWLKQRRRWTKGWIQTLIVLAWDSPDSWRKYGVVQTLFIVLLLTNLVVGPPLLPAFGLCLLYHAVVRDLPDVVGTTRVVEATLTVCVIALGIGSTLWAGYIGIRTRRLHGFIWSLPLLLPYQLMISVAAWLGLYDLLFKPFHWYKTDHGRAARRKA